ncbi:MAG: porin [Holosporales bacterium]|nr:porin [Holosporales bacterium]
MLFADAGNAKKLHKKKLFSANEQLEIQVKKERKDKKTSTKIVVNNANVSLFGTQEVTEITLHPVKIQKPTSKATVVQRNISANSTTLKQQITSKTRDSKPKIMHKLIPLWEQENDKNVTTQQINDSRNQNHDDKRTDPDNKSLSQNQKTSGTEVTNDINKLKLQSNILNKVLQEQEITNSTEFIVPTGSALFGLRDIPRVENDTIENADLEENEDILDFRLMQKLRKKKKKQNKEQRNEGSTQPIVTVVRHVSKQQQSSTTQPIDDCLNKFIHIEAQNEPSKKEDNNAKLEQQVELEQQQYKVIECEVNSLEQNRMLDDKAMKFYESNEYKYMPMPEIKTEESPQLKFSGDICFHAGTVVQEDARDNKDGDLHVSFGWTNLGLEVAGIIDDFKYKYFTNLQAIPSDINIINNYAELSCSYGTLQFGNLKGPEGTMIDDATGLLGGACGVDGSMWGLYSVISGLPHTHHLNGYTKRSTKIVYYSPLFAGFQLGVGFCPNPHHVGWSDLGAHDYSNSNDDNVLPTSNMKKRNNTAIGLSYKQDINDLSIKASVVAVNEKASLLVDIQDTVAPEGDDVSLTYDLKREIPLKKDISCQASCSLQYKNFKIAAGFTNNGEQNLPTTKISADKLARNGIHLGDAGTVWNIGGKYTIGRVDIGFARHNLGRRVTNYDYAIGTVDSFTVDCTISHGVQVFGEIDHVRAHTEKSVAALDDNNKPVKNNGTVVLIGSKVNF